jgi:hypothetical protein
MRVRACSATPLASVLLTSGSSDALYREEFTSVHSGD